MQCWQPFPQVLFTPLLSNPFARQSTSLDAISAHRANSLCCQSCLFALVEGVFVFPRLFVKGGPEVHLTNRLRHSL